MTAPALAKEYFPDLDDAALDNIIWNGTGFPNFWHIPRDGDTAEECLRTQLRNISIWWYTVC